MKAQILKVLQRNQLVDIMYVSKSGEITQRRIRVTEVMEHSFTAYCFLKHAKRTFKFENILVLIPVVKKEREVI